MGGADAGQGSGSPPGVRPGALTDLLRQVAEAPESKVAEPAPLLPGAVVGRFEILRELGRGGFGVVYEARDRELVRQVALKFVRVGPAEADEGRVSREAEAIARLSHPNLVTLHDVGRSDGSPYLVFELLRGTTLQARIDKGPMPLQEAVHIAVEVARGLAHAHAEGVVHRDLKPSNVFVTTKGQVKILDFGMAHAFGRRRLSGGTPAYMAPEQWEDDPEDERTDLFALGVMLHVMLSGEYPFPEGDGRWSAGAATAPKLDVPGAPGLADLIARLLEKAPKGRPRDGAAALVALTPIEEALRSRPADGAPPSHARQREATLGERLSSPGGRRFLGWVAAVGMGAILAVGAGLLWKSQRGTQGAPSPEAQPSIAVLPFADMSEKKDQESLADGVAEEVLNGLAQVDGLRVIGRSTSFSYKGKGRKVEEIGQELGVGSVLEGSVRRSGDKVRITAQLVRARDATTLWAKTFDRGLSDVFAVQDEIGRDVVEALAIRLLPGRSTGRTGGTTNPEALQLYLRGRDLLRRGAQELPKAPGAFEQAVAADPRFALAWVGLADALVTMEATGAELSGDPAARRRRAHEAADVAVKLAPGLADAFRARADVRQWLEADWRGQREDVERARTLAPGDSAVALSGGFSMLVHGRTDEAVAEFERVTRIDPLLERGWVSGWMGLAAAAYSRGDHVKARQASDRMAELFPGYRAFALVVIAMDRVVAGEAREALTMAAEFRAMGPPGRPWALFVEALASHDLGRPADAARAREELARDFGAFGGAYQVAQTYAWAGKADAAFGWLEKARTFPDTAMFWLKTDPLLRKIRGDPRWSELLRRSGLPPDGPAPEPPLAATPSIAVLPFADMSEKKDQAYFADGVAEEILNALAGLHGLRVTGRTSSFSLRDSKEDVSAIGRKLGVATLLEGSVRRAGTRARVTAKLVNVADGFTLWTETYDKELADVFGVQEQIARAVVAALKLKLAVGEAPSVATHRTRRPEVYDAYLVARRLLKQGPEGWLAAVPAYEKTVTLDPGYGPAWAELAEALYWGSELVQEPARSRLRNRALPAAERGVALAPELATAWSTRGFLRTLLRWDFEGGRQDFARALALSSGDARVLRDYGAVILPPLGKLDEGIAALVRSTELDPLDSMAWFFLTYCYASRGDWERASRAGARALQVDKGNFYAAYWLSVIPLVQGRAGEALKTAEAIEEPVLSRMAEAMAYHSLGDRRRSDQLLEQLERKNFDDAPYQLAEVRAWRGDHDKAFEWLERARMKYDTGLIELRYDPLLRSLRGDPRFAALLKKLNLPPD